MVLESGLGGLEEAVIQLVRSIGQLEVWEREEEQKIAEHLSKGYSQMQDEYARMSGQLEVKVCEVQQQLSQFANDLENEMKMEIERSVSAQSGVQIPQIVEGVVHRWAENMGRIVAANKVAMLEEFTGKINDAMQKMTSITEMKY